MKKSIAITKITILSVLTVYIVYIILFALHHFTAPNFEEMNINVSSNVQNPKIQDVIITIPKVSNKYYIMVFEESGANCWLYCSHQEYDKHRQKIADSFLSKETNNYILIEGNKKSKVNSIQVQPKYPLNYIATKKNTFHVIYITPNRILPFSPFYYCLHNEFYINTLN